MKSHEEIDTKRQQAYREAGWQADGHREWPEMDNEAAERERLRSRAYAEGAEAALLWVLDHAGDPFPR